MLLKLLKRVESKYEVNEAAVNAILFNEYGFTGKLKFYIAKKIKKDGHVKYGMANTDDGRIWIKEASKMQMNITLWHEIGHVLAERGYVKLHGEHQIENWARNAYRKYGNLIVEKFDANN